MITVSTSSSARWGDIARTVTLVPQYFHNIVEMEWALELALRYGKPVAATMCMGESGESEERGARGARRAR